ncbi:hypothetical protein AB4Z22_19960 [Paenibacillus sp. TAF58]
MAGDGVLRIAEASAVTLVFSGATSFLNYRDMGGDPSELNNRYMARVSERPYRELLDEHVEDHKALYERVSIRLGGAGADERTGGKRRPTDRRGLGSTGRFEWPRFSPLRLISRQSDIRGYARNVRGGAQKPRASPSEQGPNPGLAGCLADSAARQIARRGERAQAARRSLGGIDQSESAQSA